MDTVYGTKKYFQSLGACDIDYYRNSSASRPTMANYSSYHNSLRRSVVGPPYSHISKFAYPSMPDISITHHNQYGYNNNNNNNNSWGLWRDSRNLTPSISYSSSKSRKSVKSFSILLMTAAFIVIVAVLSIAALAFYFSTFKSDLDDSIMVFDGKFLVASGDVFTTGLKYNHTSVFRQKSDYYEQLISQSLENNGLAVYKCDINDFGVGPLIIVHFRIYLDMRRVPMTINSVEEHIKESILREIKSNRTIYKGLRIDNSSIEIKRLLDHEVLKSASFIREPTSTISSSTFDEKTNFNHNNNNNNNNNNKKSGNIEKTILKITPRPKIKPNFEPEIDTENAPVIQGSFEVTKTDADLIEKKINSIEITTSTLRPPPAAAITKLMNSVKSKNSTIENSTKQTKEFLTTFLPNTKKKLSTVTNKIWTTDRFEKTTELIKSTDNNVYFSTSTTTTTSTTSLPTSVSSSPTTAKSRSSAEEATTTTTTTTTTTIQTPTKLDIPLFTSKPIIDNEPWLPINPTHLINNDDQQIIDRQDDISYHPMDYDLLPRNKIRFSEYFTDNPTKHIFYQSFSNPAFAYSTKGIEKLGTSDVKPYPIPVNKIHLDNFTTIENSTSNTEMHPNNVNDNNNFSNINMNMKKYEHIGDGVIVKKMKATTTYIVPIENASNSFADIQTTPMSKIITDDISTENSSSGNESELLRIGDMFLDLLQISDDRNENYSTTPSIITITPTTTTTPSSTMSTININSTPEFALLPENTNTNNNKDDNIVKKINFINIKDIVLASIKNNSINNVPLPKTPPLLSTKKLSTTTETILFKPLKLSTSNLNNNQTTIKPIFNTNTIRMEKPPETTTPSSSSSESSFIEIETVKYVPNLWDQPLLYPVQTKWEFLNGTGIDETKSMKKVYNNTLQAWIVENLHNQMTNKTTNNNNNNNNMSLYDLKEKRINNTKYNLQNISSMFDTLSAKLGIVPNMPTKLPPFSTFPNKLKNKTNNGNKSKPLLLQKTTTTSTISPQSEINRMTKTTSKRLPTLSPSEPHNEKITTPISSSSSIDDKTPTNEIPILLINQSTEDYLLSRPDASPSIGIGQAEIEEIDPKQYEAMLSTVRPPQLITLMPVKSNSGLRYGRPSQIIPKQSMDLTSSGRDYKYIPNSNLNNDDNNSNRKLEAIVRTGIRVSE